MKSFNQELKSALLAEIIKHRKQDRVVQGTYGDGTGETFRGCAVGCAINSLIIVTGVVYAPTEHIAYEKELGIPRILGELQDVIHEGLSDEDFPTWPERFMEAVPTETDLSLVFPKFALWLLDDACGLQDKVLYKVEMELITFAIVLCRRMIDNNDATNKAEWLKLGKDAASLLVTHKRKTIGVVKDLCFALGTSESAKRNIDMAIRQQFTGYSFTEMEKVYKLCADKLIELLKAENKKWNLKQNHSPTS